MNSFYLGIRFQPVCPEFSPYPPPLKASERVADVLVVSLVDPDCPGVYSSADPRGLPSVVCEDCRSETVNRIIGEFYGFVFDFELCCHDRRAKDLGKSVLSLNKSKSRGTSCKGAG